MRRIIYIAAVLLLFCAALHAQEGAGRRAIMPSGDDMEGRYHYLAALLIIPTILLFCFGFFTARTILPEKLTGKQLLGLTWLFFAFALVWLSISMPGCPRYFWISETMEVGWPLILNGFTAGAAYSKLSKGKWLSFFPIPFGIVITLVLIRNCEPTFGF